MQKYELENTKKLSCRRGTARHAMLVDMLSTTAQLYQNDILKAGNDAIRYTIHHFLSAVATASLSCTVFHILRKIQTKCRIHCSPPVNPPLFTSTVLCKSIVNNSSAVAMPLGVVCEQCYGKHGVRNNTESKRDGTPPGD